MIAVDVGVDVISMSNLSDAVPKPVFLSSSTAQVLRLSGSASVVSCRRRPVDNLSCQAGSVWVSFELPTRVLAK